MSGPRCYRMDGTPYKDVLEWAREFEDFENRVVGKMDLPSGIHISTVWVGLDHQFGDGPPLIFETMVFSAAGEELDMERYSTLAKARAGHEALVEKWSRG